MLATLRIQNNGVRDPRLGMWTAIGLWKTWVLTCRWRQRSPIWRWWLCCLVTKPLTRLGCQRRRSLLHIAFYHRHGDGGMGSNATKISGSHRFTTFWDTYLTPTLVLYRIDSVISKASWRYPHVWACRQAQLDFSAHCNFVDTSKSGISHYFT